jgi:hypothetical protein
MVRDHGLIEGAYGLPCGKSAPSVGVISIATSSFES